MNIKFIEVYKKKNWFRARPTVNIFCTIEASVLENCILLWKASCEECGRYPSNFHPEFLLDELR
jgi:hypothetical protein